MKADDLTGTHSGMPIQGEAESSDKTDGLSFWGKLNTARPDGAGIAKTDRQAGQGETDYGKPRQHGGD